MIQESQGNQVSVFQNVLNLFRRIGCHGIGDADKDSVDQLFSESNVDTPEEMTSHYPDIDRIFKDI